MACSEHQASAGVNLHLCRSQYQHHSSWHYSEASGCSSNMHLPKTTVHHHRLGCSGMNVCLAQGPVSCSWHMDARRC